MIERRIAKKSPRAPEGVTPETMVQPMPEAAEQPQMSQLETLEARARGEKNLSESAFALTSFHAHGGQELMNHFGSARVLDALHEVNQEEGADASIFSLMKKLEPDREKRLTLYTELPERVRTAYKQKDVAEERLAARPNQMAFERHRRVYAEFTPSTALGAELTFNACRLMDSRLGKILSGTAEKSLLRSGLNAMIAEDLKGSADKLRKVLNDPMVGDNLLEAVEQLEGTRKELRDARIEEATTLVDQLQKQIREIAVAAEATLAKKINPLLGHLQNALERHAGDPTQEQVITAMAHAAQKEIEALQKLTEKDIERRTATLQKDLSRASACSAANPW